MAITNKTLVQVAAHNNSRLDISSTHITTGSFMQFRPVYYRHTIPGEHIKGSVNVLSRLAPLQVPTYGRCRINMRAWFVPFRLVFPNFDAFILDTIANNFEESALVASSPVVPNKAFQDLFTGGSYFGSALSVVVSDVDAPFDFSIGNTHYRLTYYGLCFMTILNSMGYRVMWLNDKDAEDIQYSALGLLCLARVFADWYTNDQYRNSSDYLALMRLFKFNDPTSNLVLSASDLNSILSFFLWVIYDGGKDVFVNAWDNPVAPNTGNFSNLSGSDITMFDRTNAVDDGTFNTVNMLSNGTRICANRMDLTKILVLNIFMISLRLLLISSRETN